MSHLLLPFAKQMRREPTDAEACLWRHLRAGRLKAYRFKRQAPIAGYIVDFVCFEHKLIIEADGGQHAERADDDAHRTAWLQTQGFDVLRFWNNDILRDTQSVLEVILRRLEA
jgi:very-short-patch-repair endonuclease